MSAPRPSVATPASLIRLPRASRVGLLKEDRNWSKSTGLEVLLDGQTEPDLFLVEVATYPETRVHDQLARDAALVWLERRVLPEVLTLVLHPRGNLRVADAYALQEFEPAELGNL